MKPIKKFRVARAAHIVTEKSGRYVGTDAVRKAAQRIGAYSLDESGKGVIPESVIEEMAANFKVTGYLIPRRLEPVNYES